jgi:hypothetical protein
MFGIKFLGFYFSLLGSLDVIAPDETPDGYELIILGFYFI